MSWIVIKASWEIYYNMCLKKMYISFRCGDMGKYVILFIDIQLFTSNKCVEFEEISNWYGDD